VVFISNPQRHCLLGCQRAGDARGEVVWDYHVVVWVASDGGWRVWDPDTTLGMPVRAERYLTATFSASARAPELAPLFRVVEAERFLATFATDRSHMLAADGSWLHPPPPWPPPRAASAEALTNLWRFLDMELPFDGEVLDLSQMRARYGG